MSGDSRESSDPGFRHPCFGSSLDYVWSLGGDGLSELITSGSVAVIGLCVVSYLR